MGALGCPFAVGARVFGGKVGFGADCAGGDGNTLGSVVPEGLALVADEMVRYGMRGQEVLKMVMAERLRVFLLREVWKARTMEDLVWLARVEEVEEPVWDVGECEVGIDGGNGGGHNLSGEDAIAYRGGDAVGDEFCSMEVGTNVRGAGTKREVGSGKSGFVVFRIRSGDRRAGGEDDVALRWDARKAAADMCSYHCLVGGGENGVRGGDDGSGRA